MHVIVHILAEFFVAFQGSAGYQGSPGEPGQPGPPVRTHSVSLCMLKAWSSKHESVAPLQWMEILQSIPAVYYDACQMYKYLWCLMQF